MFINNNDIKKLNQTFTVKSLLGFDDRLTSKEFYKKSKETRKQLYLHTCNFLKNTNRFKETETVVFQESGVEASLTQITSGDKNIRNKFSSNA